MKFASKIYLDGGDPEETRKADELLKKHGHVGIDGQTTNPSLITKIAISKLGFHGSHRNKLSFDEAVMFYRATVEEMATITNGPISIQVTGDEHTSYKEFIKQAEERVTWVDNAVIKFPCTYTGLKAASYFRAFGSANVTLVYAQEQAAAVYAATLNSPFTAYVSPYVGKLEDVGFNGMDLIGNVLRMYRNGDGHVKVIAASIRRIDHILYSLAMKCDCITIPFKVFTAWAALGFPTPSEHYEYDTHTNIHIAYKDILLTHKFLEYAYTDAKTEAGVAKFHKDWLTMISPK